MGRDREHRPRAEQVRPQKRRHRGGQGHRDEAAGLPLEEQDLDGQEHRGHRRVEDRRHPARRPRHQQRFPLSGGQMEGLSDDRSDRAPRHDDRSLGPEWPARADRDRRRDRLEDRDLRAHPAPADQDRLHRLGDAVPPDPLRPVTGHQPDDQPAQHRHQHRGPAQRVVRRRAWLEREVLKIEQIREQVDQPQEHQRRERTARADGHRDRGDPDQSDLRGEMSLFFHDGRSPGPLRDARRLILTPRASSPKSAKTYGSVLGVMWRVRPT